LSPSSIILPSYVKSDDILNFASSIAVLMQTKFFIGIMRLE
jgi:hypothetical protein